MDINVSRQFCFAESDAIVYPFPLMRMRGNEGVPSTLLVGCKRSGGMNHNQITKTGLHVSLFMPWVSLLVDSSRHVQACTEKCVHDAHSDASMQIFRFCNCESTQERRV